MGNTGPNDRSDDERKRVTAVQETKQSSSTQGSSVPSDAPPNYAEATKQTTPTRSVYTSSLPQWQQELDWNFMQENYNLQERSNGNEGDITQFGFLEESAPFYDKFVGSTDGGRGGAKTNSARGKEKERIKEED